MNTTVVAPAYPYSTTVSGRQSDRATARKIPPKTRRGLESVIGEAIHLQLNVLPELEALAAREKDPALKAALLAKISEAKTSAANMERYARDALEGRAPFHEFFENAINELPEDD